MADLQHKTSTAAKVHRLCKCGLQMPLRWRCRGDWLAAKHAACYPAPAVPSTCNVQAFLPAPATHRQA